VRCREEKQNEGSDICFKKILHSAPPCFTPSPIYCMVHIKLRMPQDPGTTLIIVDRADPGVPGKKDIIG
jgi:hypothetical protein